MELWAFAGALAAVYLLPGPDMLLILQTGVANGRPQAFATVAGLAMARSAHVALAAGGLAATFIAAPWTLDIVRLAGAGYLVWLGAQVLLSGPALPTTDTALPAGDATGLHAAWQRGLLTNLLNPKSLLFCSVLLPQFVDAGQDAILQQFLILGSLVVGVGILFDTAYAVTASRLGQWLAGYPLLQRLHRGLFGALLIGFAGQLIAS